MLEERVMRTSRPKHSGWWDVGRTRGKVRSANSENIRGRIEKGEQLRVPEDRGGGERMYGYGDKT